MFFLNNISVFNKNSFKKKIILKKSKNIDFFKKKNWISIKKKSNFNNLVTSGDFFILKKKIKTSKKIINYLRFLINFFKKAYIKNLKFSKFYLPQIFIHMLLTHDVNIFTKKLTYFLYSASKQQILEIIRNFNLLNQKQFKKLFNTFNVLGLYIKISGKFNGFGGAKKMRKHLILHQSKFTDKNIKIKRSVQNIRHKVGLTTWSVFASFK